MKATADREADELKQAVSKVVADLAEFRLDVNQRLDALGHKMLALDRKIDHKISILDQRFDRLEDLIRGDDA